MIDSMTFSTKSTAVKCVLLSLAVATHLLAPQPVWAQSPGPPPSAYSVPQPSPQYGGNPYGGAPSNAPPNAGSNYSNPVPATPPSFATPGSGAAPAAPPQPAPPAAGGYANPESYGGNVYSPPPPTFNPQYNDTPSSMGPVAPYPPVVTGPEVRDADLIIQGYPARTGRIMFGGAVNSDAGVTGQVTIDERNFDISRWPTSFQDLFSGTAFRGAGQTFRLEAVPGSQFQRYTAQFADPNLLGYLPISMSVSGFYYDRRFDDWDEGRLGGRLSFGYRITPDLSISAGGGAQNVDISRPTDPTLPQLANVLGDNSLFTGNVSLIHDTRNSPLQPSEGHYVKAKYEQAFGDFDYGRFEGEYRKYWLMRERPDGSGKQTLTFASQLGFSGKDTPLFENFFAGGYATMRGFDFRGASPTVPSGGSLIQVGGRFQWLNTLEYMFPLTADDAFRGVTFVDFGTVEQDIEINEDNFRVAPGFGFRVAIPMLGPAPLAFDFAFPVMKSEFDDERMFSFYMSTVR